MPYFVTKLTIQSQGKPTMVAITKLIRVTVLAITNLIRETVLPITKLIRERVLVKMQFKNPVHLPTRPHTASRSLLIRDTFLAAGSSATASTSSVFSSSPLAD